MAHAIGASNSSVSKTVSISSKNSTESSKTYGINSTVKTNNGGKVNVTSGLTVSKSENGAKFENSVSVDTGKFTYTTPTGKSSVKIAAASASAKGGVIVGGGAQAEVKASLAEVEATKTVKVFGAEIKVSGEAGIGVAIGGKAGISSNSASLGGKANVLPGVYAGVSIDIKF